RGRGGGGVRAVSRGGQPGGQGEAQRRRPPFGAATGTAGSLRLPLCDGAVSVPHDADRPARRRRWRSFRGGAAPAFRPAHRRRRHARPAVALPRAHPWRALHPRRRFHSHGKRTMTELAFTNATIVLADDVITGSVLVRDGVIAAIDTGSVSHGEDLGGEYLI